MFFHSASNSSSYTLNGHDVALLLNPIFPGNIPREMKTYLEG